jgi:hypothetical protein
MTKKIPSPTYLLLSNPTWGDSEQYESVLEALSVGIWQFNPNETHGDISLLRGLILGWTDNHRNSEQKLVPLVSNLLRLGAHAQTGLGREGELDRVRWSGYGATKTLLHSGGIPGMAEDAGLEVDLMSALGAGGSIANMTAGILQQINARQGWNTKVRGIGVVPWMALHAREAGEALPGWVSTKSQGSGAQAQKVRLLRKLISIGGAAAQLSAGEKLMTVIGASAMASQFTGTVDEHMAQASMFNTLGKFMEGVPLLETISEIASDAGLDKSIRARMGGSIFNGLGMFTGGDGAGRGAQGCMLENQRLLAWDVLAAGMPLWADKGVNKTLVANRFIRDNGAPTADFWQKMPCNGETQELMIQLLLASFAQSKEDAQIQFIAGMSQWARQSPGLPEVSMTQLLENGASCIKGNNVALAALENYCMESSTQRVAVGAKSSGMRL